MTGNIGRPGHRRELDHRPVQRHGLAPVQQHHQPARRPRLHQRRAPRRRSPASSASTRRASRTQTSLAYDQILERIAGRARSRACGSSPPTRRTPGSTSATPTTCCRASTSWSCRTCTPRTETAAARRPVLPAAGWGEKEGTFINSERRLGLIKKVARAPGQALADFHIFQLVAEAWGVRRHVPALDQPRGGVRDPEGALARPALRHHRHRRLRHARPAGGVQWPLPEGTDARAAASGGCSRTAASSTPTAGPG